jgi:hypothetical protein
MADNAHYVKLRRWIFMPLIGLSRSCASRSTSRGDVTDSRTELDHGANNILTLVSSAANELPIESATCAHF